MKNNRMEWQAKYLQAKYLLPDVRVVTQLHKPSKLFGPNCYASRWVYYKDNLISKSMYMTDLDKNDYYDRNAVNKLTEEETRKMDGSIFNSLSDEVQQEIYDDATVDYLQGTWSGTHFNDNIKVVFNNNHVKIYVNDKITDDVDYVIFNGNVRVNKLVKDIKVANSEYDYEMFNGVAAFKKKNDILLTAYFTKNDYSTCELLKETK